MPALFTAWLFVVGCCVGSFLNVVIARVPAGESIVRPGSHCPRCGHPLRWYENVPLFSFLALRGRCSACRSPISWRYPAVELLVGEHHNHFELPETLGNPYGLLGRAALDLMGLASVSP